MALQARKKLKEAGAAFQRVLELQPSHVDARIRLSSIQQRLGMPEQAFETLRDYDLDAGTSIPVRFCPIPSLFAFCRRSGLMQNFAQGVIRC